MLLSCKSSSKEDSQMTSFPACMSAVYSASQVDRLMVICPGDRPIGQHEDETNCRTARIQASGLVHDKAVHDT